MHADITSIPNKIISIFIYRTLFVGHTRTLSIGELEGHYLFIRETGIILYIGETRILSVRDTVTLFICRRDRLYL